MFSRDPRLELVLEVCRDEFVAFVLTVELYFAVFAVQLVVSQFQVFIRCEGQESLGVLHSIECENVKRFGIGEAVARSTVIVS